MYNNDGSGTPDQLEGARDKMFSEGQKVNFVDEDGKTQPGKVMAKQGENGYFVRTDVAIYLVPENLISQRK